MDKDQCLCGFDTNDPCELDAAEGSEYCSDCEVQCQLD